MRQNTPTSATAGPGPDRFSLVRAHMEALGVLLGALRPGDTGRGDPLERARGRLDELRAAANAPDGNEPD